MLVDDEGRGFCSICQLWVDPQVHLCEQPTKLLNRKVFPHPAPTQSLAVNWSISFEEAVGLLDEPEQGTLVSQAMNAYGMEDDPL